MLQGSRITSIEEFEKLPVGTAIIVIPTEEGLDKWKRQETSEWLEAIGETNLLYKIEGYRMAGVGPDREGEYWRLAPADFGKDANIYLAKPARCIYCKAPVEYTEKYTVCTECYRVQEE